MRGVLPLAVLFVALTLACASERTWRGEIGDSACRNDHFLDEHANIVTPRDCTLDCVGRGMKFVLVTDGQIYPLENQDHPGLKELAGQMVQLTGYLHKETITITRVEPLKLSSRVFHSLTERVARGL